MDQDLTTTDKKTLEERGLELEDLNRYQRTIEQGFPFIRLHGNASPPRHIKIPSESEKERWRSLYREENDLDVMKFVPASGAASRMFKELYSYVDSGEQTDNVREFLARIEEYPFFKELNERSGEDFTRSASVDSKRKAVEFLLSDEGMNYGAYPKGLIKFHIYPDGHTRTAFEEHFHEGAMYAAKRSRVKLHFTIPAESEQVVKDHLESLRSCLSEMYNLKFEVETSLQKASTDTPAIYADHSGLVRKSDGTLLFRPAGHGALLENLNDLDSDVVFIKNIDNVVPDRLKAITVENKELLAGMLIDLRRTIHGHCKDYDSGNFQREECLESIRQWFGTDCSVYTDEELYAMLHRPLRVCGMVKNEGEPGGGPFLVEEPKGNPSLQIVEKAQIDPDNEKQQSILAAASHFNPVDLVISIRDHKGNKYDLLKYRNENTGMVVDKTFEGRGIKALELPGLWNGAMHNWNTIFVEVPIETFNPVKTVFDLRRPNHC